MPGGRRRTIRLQAERLEPRWAPSIVTLASLLDNPDGAHSFAEVLEDSHGNLFGTTSSGGSAGDGTVYEVKAGTGTVTTLANFNGTNGADPEAGLIEDGNGDLFGTAYGGGAAGLGTVFEVPAGSSTITTLATFNGTNGANPIAGLIRDNNGNLFGTTVSGGPAYTGTITGDGTVFEVPSGGSGTITTLASFDGTNGSNPVGGLIEDGNGNFFGTTYQGQFPDGTVFELPSNGSGLATLATFDNTNGANPEGTLVEDGNGNLFGTTLNGGTNGEGTVFEVQPLSGTATSLVSFNVSDGQNPDSNLLLDGSGDLFGTTVNGGTNSDGTLFELPNVGSTASPSYGTTITTLADFSGANGANPIAGPIMDGSGNFFGTTTNGGASGYGEVYELASGSGTITPLASFPGTTGASPVGGLFRDSNGNLFGTLADGGPSGDGTVFELPSGSSTIQVLAAFNGANGATPYGGLIEDSHGNLFGTTVVGGESGDGTVFELPSGSNTINTLASFDGSNGANPYAGLIMDNNGDLFGTTYHGGPNGSDSGTVFELPSGSTTISMLAAFDGTDGANPAGALVEDSNGDFFGTTVYGGPAYTGSGTGDGTVFEVPSSGSGLANLVSFDGTNGANPFASLTLDNSGNLFGTTINGGVFSDGTVFELPSNGSGLATLASFNNANGAYPYCGLVEDSHGNFFGTTYQGGPDGNGTVFEVPSGGSGTITTLASFDGANGDNPIAGVVEDGKGNFFGTTYQGGLVGEGTVFEVPATLPVITTASLADWTVNQPGYSQTIGAMGGTGSLTFSSTGTLPPGLTLSTVGALSGTPTTVGSYTFTVTATDAVGASGSQSYTVVIYPAATTLVVATGSTATAGTPFSLTVTAEDGGGNLAGGYSGTVTLSSSLGADIAPTSVTLTGGTATLQVTLTGAGSQTLTAAATGLTSGTASIAVSPGAFNKYLVSIVGSSTVVAGTGFLVTVQATDQYGNPVASYSGPSTVVPISNPTSSAGSFPTTVSINSSGFGLFLVDLQKVGTYTISATVNGSSMGSSGNVTIVPGQALKLGFATQPVSEPTGDTLPPVTVQVQDLYGNPVTTDSTDSVTLAVASGPGPFTAGSTTTAILHNGVATFNNLTLSVPGTYSLSEVVPALYIGPNSMAFTVTPLQVVPSSFSSSPSGFSLSFNAPFYVNTTILNPLGGPNVPALYGSGFGASGIVPSLTLTQTSGQAPNGFKLPYQVAGSVVLNPATNSLTFIPTNISSYLFLNGTPVLPDGTYVVDVAGKSAGVTGFQAFNAGGGYLAGNMPNGDWTTTFTVGAAAAKDEVVWLPATAIGPGQALEAPGYTLSGGGEPIYLYDPSATPGQTGDVTSVTGTLTYNPSYLTVTSGMGGPYLTITQTATPGVATFAYNGPPVTFNGSLNIGNTGIASTPLGYLNWSGALSALGTYSLGGPGSGGLAGAPSSSGNVGGGTTYYYEISSTVNGVASPASAVVSVSVPAGDTSDSISLYWPQDLVATGYILYRTSGPTHNSSGGLVTTVPAFAANSVVTTITNDADGATLFYQDSGSTPLTAGTPPSTAGFGQATVPNGTVASPLSIYQSKDVLTVSGVTVKAGMTTLPSIGNGAVHLVAFVGDADGNGVYTSGGDAVELTRVHFGTDSGFPAYPLIDPSILGDTDGDGRFDGDAAFQISELSIGAAAFSVAPVPSGVHVSPGDLSPSTILPVGNGLDPTLILPSTLQVGADGTVVVPINIDDARPAGSTGLVEADLALTYNPSLFTVSASDVHAGSVLAGGTWSVVPTIDQATGQIGIVLSSSTPVSAPIGGSLVTIDFHPVEPSGGRQPPGYSGQAQFALVASVTPNGQYIPTELKDTQGAFTLTPAPTNSFDPRIDGVIFLTALPATAPVNSSLITDARASTASSMVETQGADNRTTEALPTANPNPPAPAVESNAQDTSGSNAGAEITPIHGGTNLHGVAGAILGSAATIAAAPLPGLVFQVASSVALSAPAGAGMAAGQSLADQVFQALARGTNNLGDPTQGGTAKEALERVLAHQLLRLPLAADDLEDLNWNDIATDLEGLGLDQPAWLLGRAGRRALPVNSTAPAPALQAAADQAAVDQYYAQAADDMQKEQLLDGGGSGE